MITGITIEADSVVIRGSDFDALCSLARENEQLRGNLSLAEEGLANYQQEVEDAKHDIERLMAACNHEANEVERLKAHMRNVAGWLNNGCEPAKGAAELLLIAGLPPPQSGDATTR